VPGDGRQRPRDEVGVTELAAFAKPYEMTRKQLWRRECRLGTAR
jgi:hypothetical protein